MNANVCVSVSERQCASVSVCVGVVVGVVGVVVVVVGGGVCVRVKIQCALLCARTLLAHI